MMGIPQVFVAVGGVCLFVARRRQGVGRRLSRDTRRDATKSSGNARDAPTRLGTVPRQARRRGGNEPIPVSSSEDIAPTASEASSTSGSAPTIDSEAVVSSRGADIVVPGAEGNEERLAKTASDATEITASTENAGETDVIDDKDVEEGKAKAGTSREGPPGGDANAGHEGDGNSVQVNNDAEDRSSFGGSVSKTPIRPHASGGLGRVVTRSSSPPLSSSSRKRRTAALAAVRAAARAASTASSLDGSNSGEPATDATDEDDSEVTGPSPDRKRVTFANDENRRSQTQTIANDENAAPPASPATPARVLVKDAKMGETLTLAAVDQNRSPKSPSTEVNPGAVAGNRFFCDSPLVCATPVVGTKRPVRGENGRYGLTRKAQIRIVKSPSFTDRSMAPLTALSPPKDVVWEEMSAREQANWVGAGKVPNFSRFKTPGPKFPADRGEEEDEDVTVRVSHEAMHAVGNMRYSAENAWSSPSDGGEGEEEGEGPYGPLVSTLSPNTMMDGASPATFARRYVEASVTRVEGMAADDLEHEAIARAYVDASEMRVGAMLRASGN